jgi:hypothetical protein
MGSTNSTKKQEDKSLSNIDINKIKQDYNLHLSKNKQKDEDAKKANEKITKHLK